MNYVYSRMCQPVSGNSSIDVLSLAADLRVHYLLRRYNLCEIQCCVAITQYGSTVYIGIAIMGVPALYAT